MTGTRSMSRHGLMSGLERSSASLRLLHSSGSAALRRHCPCGPQRRGRRSEPARAAQAGYMRTADMSQTMTEIRARMEEDEQLSVLMAGLRGSNINASDFADEDVVMQLISVEDADGEMLPLTYEPELITEYWMRRPVSVVGRVLQLLGIGGGFMFGILQDYLNGRMQINQVKRAVQLRNIMTSLGPAYIKLGQAMSIRPDLLSPAAMVELQRLCDKVPSFDSRVAMMLMEKELGAPWTAFFSELSPEPIAAASLGQVYKGRLKSGELVAVKVQRPHVVETVSVDLFIIRSMGIALRRFLPLTQERVDIVGLLDEWAGRFFEELDYVREGNNATRFAEEMRQDLPQIVVPRTYHELTTRRVLTSQWIEGEKLSQSTASDVGTLVQIGVIAYCKQLLETGNFHADPHPGNLIRTPDGRLAILDFGLMTQISPEIKIGMVEAIAQLVHKDYSAIVDTFVTLEFIPAGTDLKPILPVLAKVFDQALAGGGAKNINFQDLAADLAQITFDYPFRIPPYFALIIRAIGVLEGIALVGNPEFAIVDAAYPFVAAQLLRDDSPRLREALRYMVYGRENLFDAERVVDLLGAFESFASASSSAQGNMGSSPSLPVTQPATNSRDVRPRGSGGTANSAASPYPEAPSTSWPWPAAPYGAPRAAPAFGVLPSLSPRLPFPLLQGFQGGLFFQPEMAGAAGQQRPDSARRESGQAREALRFMFSPSGSMFREFLLEEMVKSIDALSRNQARQLIVALGLSNARLPLLLPGAARSSVPLAPEATPEDERVIANLAVISNFLAGRGSYEAAAAAPVEELAEDLPTLLQELMPFMPEVAREVVPQLVERLVSRITARALRDVFVA